MRLKSFYGPTVTAAMSRVREALGDDAIIISTRDDDMGGVRVTAAIDEPLTVEERVAIPIADELVEDVANDSIDVISEALTQHRVPASLSEKLIASATQFAQEDPFLSLGAALEMHFSFDPISMGTDKRCIALIGPPGAGKTLCTAKLATQATMAGRKMTVISTDMEKAGASEQLKAFTRILECDMVEIDDAPAVQDAVAMQKPETMIIVDTAGCNPFDPASKQRLEALLKAARAEPVIVMPADINPDEAIDIAEELKPLGARQLLPTRLDLVRRVGGLLNIAYETKLTLCQFSASPKISEQPQPMNPVTLGRFLLPPSNMEAPKQQATGTYE